MQRGEGQVHGIALVRGAGEAGELAAFKNNDPTLIAIKLVVDDLTSDRPLMWWSGDGFNYIEITLKADGTIFIAEWGGQLSPFQLHRDYLRRYRNGAAAAMASVAGEP